MKKYPVALLLLFSLPFIAFSQTDLRLSLKVNPAITFNRFTSETDSLIFSNNEDDVRPTFGLAADIGLTESYFFSTGILYSLRNVNLSANTSTGLTENEKYQLEYIEIPITLKLYTNDLGVDSKIYFQTGFMFDILVNWKGATSSDDMIEKLKFFDTSFFVGTGFDKQLGVSTAIFIGIYYQRGLVNVANDNPEFTLKNDLLGLELGLRF